MDDIDRRILAVLQEDGRISLADLSVRVALSPSPCLRRIRRLERSGIIARYVAVLDQSKVGLPVSVFVSIKLESQRVEALWLSPPDARIVITILPCAIRQ